MDIKVKLPSLYEEKKIEEQLQILKLVLPNTVNHIKDFPFLKSILYGSKKV